MNAQRYFEARAVLETANLPYVLLPEGTIVAPVEPASASVETASLPASALASDGTCS